ncbi:hypothetical protein AMC85_CH04066 [Rhizobium phaseoli]|nr:hypothetical protein AMC88_CH04069 [Rhizobium phaseoli]ANL61388.1 hypothetical protein AMC85_CH04066 [Rhizobium phaseoli]
MNCGTHPCASRKRSASRPRSRLRLSGSRLHERIVIFRGRGVLMLIEGLVSFGGKHAVMTFATSRALEVKCLPAPRPSHRYAYAAVGQRGSGAPQRHEGPSRDSTFAAEGLDTSSAHGAYVGPGGVYSDTDPAYSNTMLKCQSASKNHPLSASNFWTPITPPRVSNLHAETPVSAVAGAPSARVG